MAALVTNELRHLQNEFIEYLSDKLHPFTVETYRGYLSLFLFFIDTQTEVAEIKKITKGMVNSKFSSFVKKKSLNCEISNSELQTLLRDFFWYVENKKEINCGKILDYLT